MTNEEKPDFFARRQNGEGRKQIRLAVAGDPGRTRYVKIPPEGGKIPPEGGKVLPHDNPKQGAFRDMRHSAYVDGRSYFSKRGVKKPSDLKNLLVSGHSNVKIGKTVLAKKFHDYKIFTLSLEERATCPRSCLHWENCYGNNMPYAKRIDHTAPDFLPRLESELRGLFQPKNGLRPAGVLVRLHALGDFYSPEYVLFWSHMLNLFPKLAIYGYTARQPDSTIGTQLRKLMFTFGERAMIRWSDGGRSVMSTVSIERASDKPADAFQCPEQTPGFTAAGVEIKCDNCGLCWSTTKNVAFLEH